MIELKTSVKQGKRILPPRIVFFGPEGIGKTTFAASCPKPIFIKTEEGSGKLDFARITFKNSWDQDGRSERREVAEELLEVQDAIQAIADEDHDFKTLVIDSVTGLERLIQRDLCERFNEKDIHGATKGSNFSFEKGYRVAAEEMNKFLETLTYISEQRKMMIVLIAHSAVTKFKSPDTDDFDYYELAVEKKYCAEVVKKWADAIFFANFERPILAVEQNFGQKKAKAKAQVDELRRFMFTEKRPAHTAKNRYDLPYEIALPKIGGWDSVAKLIDESFEEKKPAKATKASIAHAERE